MLINVLLPEGIPAIMESNYLVRKAGFVDNENEYTTWVEYWIDESCVHRSAHIALKRIPTFICSGQGAIGG